MSRHSSLAEQLAGLKFYSQRPIGEHQPSKTNWSTETSNDNAEDLADLHIERRWSTRPTEMEIMREVAKDETLTGHHIDGSGKKRKVTVGIGKLRFSDGTQTEKAYRRSIDGKIIQYDARLPVGAMIGVVEREERILGGDDVASNEGYSHFYKGKRSNHAVKKARGTRVDFTKAEARQMLVDAIKNTPAMPEVKVCKDGFPWKPSGLRELFMGLEKGRKGETGSVAWTDITDSLAQREMWSASIDKLTGSDKKTLDDAVVARSFADLGGEGHKRTAQRRGKARLIAANDNLMEVINKMAS